MMDNCYICGTEAKFRDRADGEFIIITCPRCGNFEITGTGKSVLKSMEIDAATASGWIREQNVVGIRPSFDSRNVRQLETLRKPGLWERAERYILAAASKCPSLASVFNPLDEELIGISYSHGSPETSLLVNYLTEKGWLEKRGSTKYRVTPVGHIAADELRSTRARSSQGFVAMWFAPEMKPVYDEGLSLGIAQAGYKPMRVDQKEHANKIDDEIIAEIRRSAFVVADFTDHRGGVYFEAGFAMGLSLPVIWTCRKDEMKKLHFDIRQYNCIDWTSAAELAVRLQQRIEAMLGRGPLIDRQ